MQADELQPMIDGYIECVFFTADEDLIPPKSGEFDATPYLGRVSPAMREHARQTCTDFYNAHAADLADYPARRAGHDLWYTRNRHGVGFWEADHCSEEQGERLTAAAHALGDCYLYRGKGGWFYIE